MMFVMFALTIFAGGYLWLVEKSCYQKPEVYIWDLELTVNLIATIRLSIHNPNRVPFIIDHVRLELYYRIPEREKWGSFEGEFDEHVEKFEGEWLYLGFLKTEDIMEGPYLTLMSDKYQVWEKEYTYVYIKGHLTDRNRDNKNLLFYHTPFAFPETAGIKALINGTLNLSCDTTTFTVPVEERLILLRPREPPF